MANRNRLYTIALIGFAILAVWLRIDAGPSSVQLSSPTTTPSPESYPPVLAYSLENGQTGEVLYSVELVEADGELQWQPGLNWQPDAPINQNMAWNGALRIAATQDALAEGFFFTEEDNLAVYGLGSGENNTPQYILSFLANIDQNAYNNIQTGQLVLFTLYIGNQRDTRNQDYYGVFVNEVRTDYRGNYVYYIAPDFVQELNSLVVQIIEIQSVERGSFPAAPTLSTNELP